MGPISAVPESVTLTKIDPVAGKYAGTFAVDTLSPLNGDAVLSVADGDVLHVEYIDADDGAGGTNVTVGDTAGVDCQVPLISNVRAIDVGPVSAVVTFDADEPVQATVHYGPSCGALTQTASGSGFP